MRKYVIPLTMIILLFTGFFTSHTMRDSELTIKKRLSYNTRQQAIENKLDKNFVVEFDPIYEYQIEPNYYIVVYYNAREDFLCAAAIEEKDNYFYWEKLTPYFKLENAAIVNNKGAYVIYPVVINDTKLNICLGIIGGEAKIISDVDAHIVNDKFFIILSEGKINVELL